MEYDRSGNYPDWACADKDIAYKSMFVQLMDYHTGFTEQLVTTATVNLGQYLGRPVLLQGAAGVAAGVRGVSGTNSGVFSFGSGSKVRASFNITASIIDTLTAKLASIDAVPQVVTEKATAKGRKLANDLNHLIKGLFHKYQLSHEINLAYRAAMIDRAGFLKILKEDGKIWVERVHSCEIVVDVSDSYYNNPYKMIHKKAVPVEVLIAKYPKFKKEILQATPIIDHHNSSVNRTPQLLVAEAWCRNSYVPNGRHIIAIHNCVFIDEDWDKDYFPVIKCEYLEPPIGYYGKSVVDSLFPIQTEINRILAAQQTIMKLMSVPTWIVDNNAQMNDAHRTNQIGTIWHGNFSQGGGLPPVLHNGAAMPPELQQCLEFQIAQAYAQEGLTPLDTQGQQLAGTGNQSGEALKTMTEIKSERWQSLQKNYERTHVQLAEILLRELEGEDIKISALDRKIGLREISTKVIPNVHDSYVLQIYPVSALPDSIPDLLDSVSQMLQLGVIQPSSVPDLFKMPDIDAVITMQTAAKKLVDANIEEMLETGKYINPEPYDDLKYALTTATQNYAWARLNKQPAKTLALLRRYINDLQTLLAQVALANTPPQGVKQ